MCRAAGGSTKHRNGAPSLALVAVPFLRRGPPWPKQGGQGLPFAPPAPCGARDKEARAWMRPAGSPSPTKPPVLGAAQQSPVLPTQLARRQCCLPFPRRAGMAGLAWLVWLAPAAVRRQHPARRCRQAWPRQDGCGRQGSGTTRPRWEHWAARTVLALGGRALWGWPGPRQQQHPCISEQPPAGTGSAPHSWDVLMA